MRNESECEKECTDWNRSIQREEMRVRVRVREWERKREREREREREGARRNHQQVFLFLFCLSLFFSAVELSQNHSSCCCCYILLSFYSHFTLEALRRFFKKLCYQQNYSTVSASHSDPSVVSDTLLLWGQYNLGEALFLGSSRDDQLHAWVFAMLAENVSSLFKQQ